jgi:Ssp1 endopeptidase immunity protein Rap1a
MRSAALIVLACLVVPARAQQQQRSLPRDGNELLSWCSILVDAADSPAWPSTLSADKVAEEAMKFGWCAGYLDATEDATSLAQIHLAMAAKMGMTLSGPDQVKAYAMGSLVFACIPEKAPTSQLARVLVKWLREHPERLHEPKSILVQDAFKNAFPCSVSVPAKESTKPTPAGP